MSTINLKVDHATLTTALDDDRPLLLWMGTDGETPPSDVKKALEEASTKYEGRLHVFIGDTHAMPDLKAQFNVGKRALAIGWHNGEVVNRRQRPWATDIQSLAEKLAALAPQREPQAADTNSTANKEIDMKPVDVTDATFEAEVLNHELPVVVDFWAEWCGPCRMVAPILDKLAGEYAGKVRIAKVDVDANPGLAQAFRIQSIPTMMFIKEGKIVGQQAGALPEPVLRDAFEQLIEFEIPA
jgi:thioredoxin 1